VGRDEAETVRVVFLPSQGITNCGSLVARGTDLTATVFRVFICRCCS
jgi:hypothetical protein